jgi:glutamate-ammonia-ligase adenylyltransferase
VAGDRALAARFEEVRRALLCLPRDPDDVAAEVLKMRRRLAEHHGDVEDLKQGSGGIVDIEFMVQYLVLAHAHAHPSLTEFTDNVRILDGVERLGLLPADLAARLREAYLGLRSEWHRGVLDIPDRDRAVEVLSEYRSDVREAWRLLFGHMEPDDGASAPAGS